MPPDDDLIEIAVDDLALGPHDGDGLVEPKVAERKPAAKKEPAAPAIDAGVLETLKRQSYESEAKAERAEAAAAEERTRAASEREARIKAEEQASKSTEFGWRAHWAKVNADHDSIKSALGSTQQAIDNDTAALQAASEAGDHAGIARLNAQIAKNSSYLTRLEEGRSGAETAIADAKREYAAYAESRTDPVKDKEPEVKETKKQPPTPDEFIANSPVATRSWLKDNKGFAVMGSKEQKKLDVFAAEWLLDHDDDRSTLNTQAFVDALEAKFTPKKAEPVEEPEAVAEEEEVIEEQPKAQPRKAATAAPVSRASTPSSSSGSLGKITLTRSQADIAPQLYDKYEDFDPEVKAKFPNGWSETAARFQYHQHLQMAKKEKGHRFTS